MDRAVKRTGAERVGVMAYNKLLCQAVCFCTEVCKKFWKTEHGTEKCLSSVLKKKNLSLWISFYGFDKIFIQSTAFIIPSVVSRSSFTTSKTIYFQIFKMTECFVWNRQNVCNPTPCEKLNRASLTGNLVLCEICTKECIIYVQCGFMGISCVLWVFVCGHMCVQIKHSQDEERKKLFSLRDQLRPALQPEFKEVITYTLTCCLSTWHQHTFSFSIS